MASGDKLRVRTKLSFGMGAIAEAAILIAFNTWNFLFYNQVLGLSGTLAGLAVTFSLVLDAVADPVVGSISDRWRSKLGRRHPFMFVAAIPLAVTFFLLYVPPSGLHGFGLFLWFTVFATLHRQALTLYQVPHLALGAELSHDYHERSAVMAYATLFGVVGGAGAYFFGWTWFKHVQGGALVRDGYPGLGLCVGGIAAVAILVSAFFTRDQIPRLVQPAQTVERHTVGDMFKEIRGCLANYNYRVMLLGLIFVSATTGTRETVSPYTSLFFWELPADKIRVFGLASPPGFIIAFFLTVWLHKRFDKRATIIFSLILMAAAGFLPVPLRLMGLMPANNTPGLVGALFLAVFVFYLGVAVLTISALSALADIADEHELNSGRRQEGVFFAARTFFSKLSSALGHVIAGVALDLIKFPTGAKPGQVAHDTVTMLGILDGPVGTIPAILAIFFYAAYRIDRKKHAEIQAQLAARRQQNLPPPASIPPAPITGIEPAL
jgi:Na+/melibiose symporter-like transporter